MPPRAIVHFLAAFLFAVAPLAAGDPASDPRSEVRRLSAEIVRGFQSREFGALPVRLDELERLSRPTPFTLNMRASLAIEHKDWKDAVRLCKEALKMDPRYYPARINIGEILMLTGRTGDARTAFEKMQDEFPGDEMLQYRIFLTHLVEKNDAAAREVLGKLKFPSSTPAFYYANAAWEFTHGNEEAALAWVARGNWVAGEDVPFAYSDFTLARLGWLKRNPTPTVDPTAPDGAKPRGPLPEVVAEGPRPSIGFEPTSRPKFEGAPVVPGVAR